MTTTYDTEVTVREASKRTIKGRIYVWDAPEPDMPLPPYSTRGKDAEIDAEWDRYNRAEVKVMRAVAQQEFPGVKMRFSRRAGCSCSCSPGFVIEDDEYRGKDISINVKGA